MRIYITYTYSYLWQYGSFCEGYGHFWVTPGKISEDLSCETGERPHRAPESGGFSRSAFGLQLICKTCNEIHSYIYEHISTYRPTFFLNSTRESKDQIGMVLVLKEEAASLKINGSLYSCLLISRLPSGSRMLDTGCSGFWIYKTPWVLLYIHSLQYPFRQPSFPGSSHHKGDEPGIVLASFPGLPRFLFFGLCSV